MGEGEHPKLTKSKLWDTLEEKDPKFAWYLSNELDLQLYPEVSAVSRFPHPQHIFQKGVGTFSPRGPSLSYDERAKPEAVVDFLIKQVRDGVFKTRFRLWTGELKAGNSDSITPLPGTAAYTQYIWDERARHLKALGKSDSYIFWDYFWMPGGGFDHTMESLAGLGVMAAQARPKGVSADLMQRKRAAMGKDPASLEAARIDAAMFGRNANPRNRIAWNPSDLGPARPWTPGYVDKGGEIFIGRYKYRAEGMRRHFYETIGRNRKVQPTDPLPSGQGQLDRPYMRSPQLIAEIMATAPGTQDVSVPTARRWEVQGTYQPNGSPKPVHGTWELVIDLRTNEILHFLFRSP